MKSNKLKGVNWEKETKTEVRESPALLPWEHRSPFKQNSTDTQRRRVSRNGGFPRAQTMCTESCPLLPPGHGWTLQPNSRSPTLGKPWVGKQWDKQDVKVSLIVLRDDWCHWVPLSVTHASHVFLGFSGTGQPAPPQIRCYVLPHPIPTLPL